MSRRASPRCVVFGIALLVGLVGSIPSAAAVPAYDFATPVFGLSARGNVLYAADAGAGVVRLGADNARLVAELPGVTDVLSLRRGRLWAVTSAPKMRKLFRVVHGHARMVANLGRFEREVNPDEGAVDSNPFDLAKLGRKVLVADAAANALLVVNRRGRVDWVATLPDEIVSTDNIKSLAGCPNPPPEYADFCDLPDTMPAEPVTTSVAVGPDGAYYLTELKGFPAPTGESRVWRIEPGTRHVHCDAAATDSACTVVADGFTSIVDVNFASDGTAFVVELDEASWAAVEIVQGAAAGGTVNECDTTTTPWTCTERATDLTQPMAVAVATSGGVFAVVSALIEGQAQVVELT